LFEQKGMIMRLKLFIIALIFLCIGLFIKNQLVTSEQLCYVVGSIFVLLAIALDDRKK